MCGFGIPVLLLAELLQQVLQPWHVLLAVLVLGPLPLQPLQRSPEVGPFSRL